MGISQTPVVIVAAIGSNGAIGRDNALPWTMPGDLARFRELTMGTPMIMGRRTYASIGKPLPGRESIVVSQNHGLGLPAGVHRACDPQAALALASERAAAMRAPSISLIGGATLFKALMDQTDRLCLTLVNLAPGQRTPSSRRSIRRNGASSGASYRSATRATRRRASSSISSACGETGTRCDDRERLGLAAGVL